MPSRLASGCVPILFVASLISPAYAQLNSWTKPTSGNWEEPAWSLGVLPGSGESVMITNEGWKAVAITSNTVQNYPQSLTVNSLTIFSPTNSSNSLMLNYAGLQSPLTVNSLTIGSNSDVTMLNSALQLNGPAGVGMSIGGQFNQQESSVVAGNQLDVGYVGPGVYNLVSGLLSVGHVWVGGPYQGVFNQTGGSNSAGIVHLETGGVYDMSGGDFGATVYFGSGSILRQQSGRLNSGLTIWRGTYLLESGVNYGGLTVPISDGYAAANGNASVLQTGGTNLGAIFLGVYGSGFYTLSNGVVRAPAMNIGYYGNFSQWGGTQTCTGTVDIIGGWVDRGDRALGYYLLGAGNMIVPGLYMETGSFTQNGGTNTISGELTFANTTHNFYYLNGGFLGDNTASLDSSWVGGFFQSGGLHVVTNQLSLFGNDMLLWQGYVLSGGELRVSNIVMNSHALFTRTGGTVTQSGLLTLLSSRMFAGPGRQQFGPLQLGTAEIDTNSTLFFPTNPCTLIFGDSHAQAWSADATVTVENWAGGPFGGGPQQLIFGTSAAALTAQQLNQIIFHNPPGLAPGMYGAMILSNGEVIPNALPATGHIRPTVQPLRQQDGTMQLTVSGEIGANYGIEISSNSLNWTLWTNGAADNGAMSVMDADAKNHAQRFYRAVLMP